MTGSAFAVPRGWAVPVAALSAALEQGRPALSTDVADRDPAVPLRVEATLGEWRVSSIGGTAPRLAVSIAHGTLFDDDKGPVDLAGCEILIGSTTTQPEVLDPGRLSELQQAAVAVAIDAHLRTRDTRCALAVLTAPGIAPMPGVLVASPAVAAFGVPRAICESAGALPQLSALAVSGAGVPLTTMPGGESIVLQAHTVSIDDAICLVGRLDSPRIL